MEAHEHGLNKLAPEHGSGGELVWTEKNRKGMLASEVFCGGFKRTTEDLHSKTASGLLVALSR